MKVDRSTLFIVSQQKGVMFTLVADGAPPITIDIGKGLAGACAQAKELVNVSDAYKDDRFNPAGEHTPSHTPSHTHSSYTPLTSLTPPHPSHPPLAHPCTLHPNQSI